METERVIRLLKVEKQYRLKQTGHSQQPINKEVAEALDIAINAVGAIEQVRWERDTAIEQLNSYGVGLCENADVQKIVKCKDCKYNVANWQHDEDDGTDYTDIVCDYWMSDGLEPNKDFCSKGVRIDA